MSDDPKMNGKTDRDLVDNVIRRCANKRYQNTLWESVARELAVGSTLAQYLCRRAGYHPDSGEQTFYFADTAMPPSLDNPSMDALKLWFGRVP